MVTIKCSVVSPHVVGHIRTKSSPPKESHSMFGYANSPSSHSHNDECGGRDRFFFITFNSNANALNSII